QRVCWGIPDSCASRNTPTLSVQAAEHFARSDRRSRTDDAGRAELASESASVRTIPVSHLCRTGRRAWRSPAARDLLFIGVVSGSVVGLEIPLNFFGPLVAFIARSERLQLDAFAMALFVSPFLLSVFMLRRWLESCREVRQRRALEGQLQHQAFYDTLTSLPNRALFLDRLRQALARTHRRSGPEGVAVLLLDLDDFKLINDSLGHAAGDDLLCSVAQRLSDSLRPGDTAARLGGDEFALLLEPVADAAELVVVAEQLRAAVHAP